MRRLLKQCSKCGAELPADARGRPNDEHLFENPGGSTIAQYCLGCCPRCSPTPTETKEHHIP